MADHDAPLTVAAYQDYYAKRVKHLEDFKRTFGADTTFPEDPSLQNVMTELKTNMVGLIEQDVTLMRQLLGIKDALDELRSNMCCGSPTGSDRSELAEPKIEVEHSPSVVRIPIKKHKTQRSLTHDSYDSQSSGFCSQTSSPTGFDQPVRPPRSKRTRSRDALEDRLVELVLTDPQEVCI